MKTIWATALLLCLGAIAPAQEQVSISRPLADDAAHETDLLAKYQNDLKANRNSSITHFRIGEIYFQQGNLQSSANEFRAALDGDLQPAWIEVWSHLNLGKIFDATGQRDRALNEYKLAQRTKDNTRGALEEAAIYLQIAYPRR